MRLTIDFRTLAGGRGGGGGCQNPQINRVRFPAMGPEVFMRKEAVGTASSFPADSGVIHLCVGRRTRKQALSPPLTASPPPTMVGRLKGTGSAAAHVTSWLTREPGAPSPRVRKGSSSKVSRTWILAASGLSCVPSPLAGLFPVSSRGCTREGTQDVWPEYTTRKQGPRATSCAQSPEEGGTILTGRCLQGACLEEVGFEVSPGLAGTSW